MAAYCSLFVLLACIIPRSTFAETDLAGCYGETLDVSLVAVADNGPVVLERRVFALPTPNAWLISMSGGTLLHDLPCQKEPIEVVSLWGGFMDSRLGHGRFPIPNLDEVYVRWIRLSSLVTERAVEDEKSWYDIIVSNGIEVEGGFIHRIPGDTSPIRGGWIFPDDYKSPAGTWVRMRCPRRTCVIEYRIARNLKLSYEIWIGDSNEIQPWIDIDQHVRRTVLGWIVQE